MTARRRYAHPSVHEVVLAIVFESEVTAQALDAATTLLPEAEFGRAQRVDQSRVDLVSGFGPVEAHATAEFLGWAFQTDGWPRWLVRAWLDRLTLNMMRSETWPSGDYVGWETVAERFDKVHASLSPVYGPARVRRVGLRYLNRFSIPAGETPDGWLNLSIRTPPTLQSPRGLRLRYTWDRIEGHPNVGVTINLASVPVPSPGSKETGLLLDIDVFRTGVASTYDDARQWFSAAHEAENAVFEACITQKLRGRFGE